MPHVLFALDYTRAGYYWPRELSERYDGLALENWIQPVSIINR